MSKTPVFARMRLAGSKERQRSLQEPFLSPGGSIHTDIKLEKSKLAVRWLMLALTSVLMMGSYYCYDNPAALYKNLQARFFYEEAFDYYFDLLYSVYSLPNIVLPMAGGMLVDRWGVNMSLNLFACLILAGQVIVAAGCALSSLPIMLLGRAIFGLGGESISVAQSAMITQWFSEKARRRGVESALMAQR